MEQFVPPSLSRLQAESVNRGALSMSSSGPTLSPVLPGQTLVFMAFTLVT